MTKPRLKVYSWINHIREEVVAATSKAAARKLSGRRIPTSEISVTSDVFAFNYAMADPGVVFWRPLDAPGCHQYVRAGEPWFMAPVFRYTDGNTGVILHGVRLSAFWTRKGHLSIVDIAATGERHVQAGEGQNMSREEAERRAVELALPMVKAEIARLQRALAWLEGRGEPPPKEGA